MASSIEIESGKWSGPQISEALYDTIDSYYSDDITVKLYSGPTSILLEAEPNTVRLVSPDVIIYDKNNNPLLSNYNSTILPGTFSFSTNDTVYNFSGQIYLAIEKHRGIPINVKYNNTTACLAKAIYPNTIVFGFQISEIPENILKAVLSVLGKYSLMTDENKYNEEYTKYSKENMRQILLAPYLSKKHQIIKQIYDTNESIDNYKKRLRQFEDTLKDLNRQLVDICEICDADISSALKEIDDINKLHSVTWSSGISLFDEGKLQVKTEPIYCICQKRRYLFGEYLIEFNFVTRDVTFTNMNPDLLRRSYWGERCHHPHIDTTGKACLGNIRNDIDTALKDMSFSYAVILAISFLRSVNIHDAAGKYVINWPTVDDEGNILTQSCDDLARCCTCGTLLPDDDAADNWAKCDICGGMICPSHIKTKTIGDNTLTICPDCERINICSCEICGEIYTTSDIVTTLFGKKVCRNCCSKIDIIRLNNNENNDFIISSVYVSDNELKNKIGKCSVCGNYYSICGEDNGMCLYCQQGHSFHMCTDCGCICSDAKYVSISQHDGVKELCSDCYSENEYKSCINCLNEYPKSDMHTINSELDIYQCDICYKKLLDESGDDNV